MKKCIAFPTDDQSEITLRTGRAKGFLFLTLENCQIIDRKFAPNPHLHSDDNEDESIAHSHADIMALLKPCDMLIARAAGKFMRKELQENTIPFEIVKETNIDQALKIWLKKQNLNC
jgi:predicted Fe-Mo cluster-binding NifX family protein